MPEVCSVGNLRCLGEEARGSGSWKVRDTIIGCEGFLEGEVTASVGLRRKGLGDSWKDRMVDK